MAEKLQETGGSFIESLREAARENPAAAALIGAGALWLLAGRPALTAARGGARVIGAAAEAGQASAAAAGAQWRSARDSATDLAGSAADRVRQVGDQVRQAGHDTRDAAAASGSHFRDQSAAIRRRVADQFNASADGLSSARMQLTELFERQPLALGAVGLTIGAAVAASLPMTRFEEDTFGETSDALRERAQAAAETAAEEARRQNLTLEGFKGEVKNKASKVADVAEKAAGTFRDKMASSP